MPHYGRQSTNGKSVGRYRDDPHYWQVVVLIQVRRRLLGDIVRRCAQTRRRILQQASVAAAEDSTFHSFQNLWLHTE